MILILRLLNKLTIQSTALVGILILRRAFLRGVIPMESNAFAISWNAIQHSFLFVRASSIMLLSIWIGALQEPPFNPAKLGPLRISFSSHIFDSLRIIILTESFLIHSSSRIGRVLFNEYSQSVGFGIG